MELPSSETSQANPNRPNPLSSDYYSTVAISRAKSHENLTDRQTNTNKYWNCQANDRNNSEYGSPFSGDCSCLDWLDSARFAGLGDPSRSFLDHLTKPVQPIQLTPAARYPERCRLDTVSAEAE